MYSIIQYTVYVAQNINLYAKRQFLTSNLLIQFGVAQDFLKHKIPSFMGIWSVCGILNSDLNLYTGSVFFHCPQKVKVATIKVSNDLFGMLLLHEYCVLQVIIHTGG